MTLNEKGFSVWSEPVSVTIPLPTPPTPPTSPANLQATVTDNCINVTWDSVSDTSSYSVNIVEEGVESYCVDAHTNSYSLTGQPGSTYRFYVMTLNEKGFSVWSEPVSVTIPLPTPPTPPTAPVNLQATATDNSINVTWDAVSDTSSYRINIIEEGVQSYSVDSYTNSYSLTGIKPGSTYRFYVMTLNDQGYSLWSEPVSVTI
jgi:uncharacterized protein YbdZ (MbtH family)